MHCHENVVTAVRSCAASLSNEKQNLFQSTEDWKIEQALACTMHHILHLDWSNGYLVLLHTSVTELRFLKQ